MNTDIRISVSFKGHRKRKRLKSILGPGATDYLLDLWISTAQNHPSGHLVGMDELDIALEAGWDGESALFVSALVSCGFLDKVDDGGYRLHDWDDHQAYVTQAPQRQQIAKNAASKRWERREQALSKPKGCSEHPSSMPGAQPENAEGNAPSFLPSSQPTSKPSVAKATGGKPPPLKPDEIIFGYGVPMLTNAGIAEKQARSFLGGLRKAHGDKAVIDKLRECLKVQPLQPLEWLAASLPPAGSGPPGVARKPQAENFSQVDYGIGGRL